MSTTSSEPAIVQTITDAYYAMMNNPNYGSSSYTISEAAWNSGGRWYDGIGAIELVARCIYAENTGLDVSGEVEYRNDRTAVAVVILNRITASYYPNTPRNVVTQANQFSPINKTTSYSAMINDSSIARSVKSKTNKAWQEATLLSCILNYTTSKTDFGLVMTIPTYITTQMYFYDARAAYNSSSFTVTGGQWKQGTTNLSQVAIAGQGYLLTKTGTTPTSLQYHKSRYGYNMFYNR